MKIQPRIIFSLSMGWVLLTGCLNNRYITPVTTFHSSTAQTISTISAFYSSRNAYEIQIYLAGVAADSTLAVGTTDASGQPTPLGQPVFSAASIKARLDALSVVATYASRLYDLANTSAPSDFATAGSALGSNLGSLDKTFQTLAGSKDPTANKYVGPISSLIGTIGQLYLNGKRDQMVKDAIQHGGQDVNTILSQIRDDMDNIFSAEIITGANEQLASAVVAYNKDRNGLSYDQRVARLAQIQGLAEAASSATASAPSHLVAAMLDANNALIKSASAPPNSKQSALATLNTALSEWISEIQTVSAEIKPLLK
jgi:hypothetical protein